MNKTDLMTKMRAKQGLAPREKKPYQERERKFHVPEGSIFQAEYTNRRWIATLTVPNGDSFTSQGQRSLQWAIRIAGKQWARKEGLLPPIPEKETKL